MSTLIIKGMETIVFGREGMHKLGIRQEMSNSDLVFSYMENPL